MCNQWYIYRDFSNESVFPRVLRQFENKFEYREKKEKYEMLNRLIHLSVVSYCFEVNVYRPRQAQR